MSSFVPEPSRAKNPQSISLDLPFPPSVNNLFLNGTGKARIKTPRYRAWIAEAVYGIKAQVRPGMGLRGPYRLLFEATAPDRRRRDLSNLLKAAEDALVLAGIVSDDSDCREINAFWTNGIVKGGHVRCIVTEV